MIDSGRIEAAVAELLAAIGEDPARPGLAATPRRVAEAYAEFFSGLDRDPRDPLRDAPEFIAEPGQLGELVLLRDIAFRSVCEHHLLPFYGRAVVGYLPDERILGLSKLARVVEHFALRPQVQERLTKQVADLLDLELRPKGVGVVLEAEHTCMSLRGVQAIGATTVTSAMLGRLRTDARSRQEFLAVAGRGATS